MFSKDELKLIENLCNRQIERCNNINDSLFEKEKKELSDLASYAVALKTEPVVTKSYRLPSGITGNQTYRKVTIWHCIDGRAAMEETFTPDKNRSKSERKDVIIEVLRSKGFDIDEEDI